MINIDKEKVDSLIFDMDGTLWDAMKSYAEVWNVAFRELGLAITVDESVLKQAIGSTIDDILVMLSKRYGLNIQPKQFLARVDEIEDELLPMIGGEPYPGMQEGMGKLSERYTILLTRLPTRDTYHAAMDVHSRISAEDTRVMNSL